MKIIIEDCIIIILIMTVVVLLIERSLLKQDRGKYYGECRECHYPQQYIKVKGNWMHNTGWKYKQ